VLSANGLVRECPSLQAGCFKEITAPSLACAGGLEELNGTCAAEFFHGREGRGKKRYAFPSIFTGSGVRRHTMGATAALYDTSST